jgi:hypothetical protein
MRTVFQIEVPSVVNIKNLRNGMFDMPAGIEMRLRTTGMNGPKRKRFG